MIRLLSKRIWKGIHFYLTSKKITIPGTDTIAIQDKIYLLGNIKNILTFILTLLLYPIKMWIDSSKAHFSHLDRKLCILIGVALLLSAGTYFFTPHDPNNLKSFLSEQVALYGIIDSYPQRIAYDVFLCVIIISTLLIKFGTKNRLVRIVPSKSLSIMLGTLVIISAIISLSSANLDTRGTAVLLITMAVALTANYSKFRWIAWISITALVICAILPGWLHTPTPLITALPGFDQHYDMVMYRGRQLAAGHLFTIDNPPYYSILWSTIIGIVSKNIQIPTFANLIRFVQISQIICLVAFAAAGFIQVRHLNKNSRAVAMTFLAIAVVPWLSTDGFAIWYPNQSGLRFLMFPIAICFTLLIAKSSPIKAGIITGGIAAIALISNFETGVVATAALGIAWLIRMHHESPAQWIYSIVNGLITLLGVFLSLGLTYHYFFDAWPLPNNITAITALFSKFNNGFGGLELPLRSLVIVIMAHSAYVFMQSTLYILNNKISAPDIPTSAIATMLLIWFPYYINRPDDWNLWTFIALYMLLLIPQFADIKRSIVIFVIASVIVAPIAARNLPYFVIDQLNPSEWHTKKIDSCAGGLALPTDYCTHLQKRGKTLRDFASRGTIAWSTSLPVLTDQTAHVKGPFWTGNLLGLSLTNNDFDEIVHKIKNMKVDFILFDDPSDPFIAPRPPETSFNQRLFKLIQNDYCKPSIIGGWLIAKRSKNGKC